MIHKIVYYLVVAQLMFCNAVFSQNYFIESHDITCGDSFEITRLGFPTWATAKILSKPKYGFANLDPSNEFQNLKYFSPACFSGSDTIIVECAKATQLTCDTGMYIFNISCNELTDSVFVVPMNCKDSFEFAINGFSAPMIVDSPNHGRAILIYQPTDLIILNYYPDDNYRGLDQLKIDRFGGQEQWLFLFQNECSKISLNKNITSQKPQFQNPVTSDYLRMALIDEKIESVFLTNNAGTSIKCNWDPDDKGIKISLYGILNGHYILNIKTNNNFLMHKLIVLR